MFRWSGRRTIVDTNRQLRPAVEAIIITFDDQFYTSAFVPE